MATDSPTNEDTFMMKVAHDDHFTIVMDIMEKGISEGKIIQPHILMEVFHKYHQYIADGDMFADKTVPKGVPAEVLLFRHRGSPKFLAKYEESWNKLQHQVFELRMAPLMEAFWYQENKQPPQIDFDVHDHLLRAMIDIRTKRTDRLVTLVSGKYVHPEGWSIGFDIEYWQIPMPGWYTVFPNLSINVHYTNEYKGGFMQQFWKNGVTIGEVLGLLSQSTEPLKWKY